VTVEPQRTVAKVEWVGTGSDAFPTLPGGGNVYVKIKGGSGYFNRITPSTPSTGSKPCIPRDCDGRG